MTDVEEPAERAESAEWAEPADTRPGRWTRVRDWFGRRWLSGPGWVGASLLVAVVALTLWLWRSSGQILSGAALIGWLIKAEDLLVAVGVGLGAALVLTIIALVVRRRLPALVLGVLTGAGLLVGTMGAGASKWGWITIVVLALLAAMLIGGWAGGLVGHRWGSRRQQHGRGHQPPRRRHRRPGRVRTASGVVGVLVAALLIGWLLWPGPVGPDPHAPLARGGEAPADPSAPGPHAVEMVSYGSAQPGPGDLFADVDVRTDPVDATSVIERWEPGDRRSRAWGFDPSALPLNALVWAPVEGGPYPLVLIVHGNSPPRETVEGFDYLGELLASRGYVVASVDQTFVNSGILDGSGLRGANYARPWLLLQHLAQWERWTAEGGGPTAATVDLDRVAVIGHSRGGEAAAVAAAHAAGSGPDQPGGEIELDSDIDTVVALAPTETRVASRDDLPELDGVNYLTMSGSHDADIGAFAGTNQYARTAVDEDSTKAAVSVHRANHSQFNSRWGRRDVGLGLTRHQLGTAALLSPEDQRQVAAVFISAFLDLTLEGDEGSRELFDGTLPRTSWLPDTDYRVTAAHGDQSLVAGFRGAEVADGTVRTPLGAVTVEGASAAVEPVPLRRGGSRNPALLVEAAEPADTVRMELPLADISVGVDDRLVVDLALVSGETPEQPVTVSVQLTGSGPTTTCPVTGASGLPGHQPAAVAKPGSQRDGPHSEPVLQTYAVPLGCAEQGGVDPTELESATLVLTGIPEGGVLLDNLGVVPDSPVPPQFS